MKGFTKERMIAALDALIAKYRRITLSDAIKLYSIGLNIYGLDAKNHFVMRGGMCPLCEFGRYVHSQNQLSPDRSICGFCPTYIALEKTCSLQQSYLDLIEARNAKAFCVAVERRIDELLEVRRYFEGLPEHLLTPRTK